MFYANKFRKSIKTIKSFISNIKSNIYIIIKQESKNNFILSKFIDILKINQDKSVNMFVEYVLYINHISFFPRIWYNGSIYLEIYKENIIYGYIKIIYVNYNFLKNKEYKKYSTIVIN